MGGQLDKRMLHWQPAKCCIFQLFIIICYLTNKILLLLLLLALFSPTFFLTAPFPGPLFSSSAFLVPHLTILQHCELSQRVSCQTAVITRF